MLKRSNTRPDIPGTTGERQCLGASVGVLWPHIVEAGGHHQHVPAAVAQPEPTPYAHIQQTMVKDSNMCHVCLSGCM